MCVVCVQGGDFERGEKSSGALPSRVGRPMMRIATIIIIVIAMQLVSTGS